jgi:hypothetical protein
MLAVAVSYQMSNQTTAISNTTNIKNLETMEFNEITQEEVEAYAWASSIKEWAELAFKYIDMTDKLANVIQQNFQTAVSYRYNGNIIKRAIIEGLPPKLKDLMLASDIVLPKKRTKEQKALFIERQSIQQKVILMCELCTNTLFYYFLCRLTVSTTN